MGRKQEKTDISYDKRNRIKKDKKKITEKQRKNKMVCTDILKNCTLSKKIGTGKNGWKWYDKTIRYFLGDTKKTHENWKQNSRKDTAGEDCAGLT